MYGQLSYATNYYVSAGSHHNFIFCFLFIRGTNTSYHLRKKPKKIETRESNAFTYEHTYLNAERVQREYKLGMHSLRHKQSLIRFCGKEVGSVGTD